MSQSARGVEQKDYPFSADFNKDDKSNAVEGDGRYAAPETFNLTSYTPKADSYSIGATVLQIAMGILHPRHARYQDTWADLKFHPERWKTDFAEEMSGERVSEPLAYESTFDRSFFTRTPTLPFFLFNLLDSDLGKSDELWECLRWLLASKPQERPSPAELLETPDMQLRVLEREKQLARNRFK